MKIKTPAGCTGGAPGVPGSGEAVVPDFEELYRRYYQAVYRHLYRLTGNSDDAGDLTHDTFIKAWRALPTLRAGASLLPWLRRIASNACIDGLRRRKRMPLEYWDLSEAYRGYEPVAADDPEDSVLRQETAAELRCILARLPVKYRTVLLLRVCGGLSYAQIADDLGTTASAVRAILHRARARSRLLAAADLQVVQ